MTDREMLLLLYEILNRDIEEYHNCSDFGGVYYTDDYYKKESDLEKALVLIKNELKL